MPLLTCSNDCMLSKKNFTICLGFLSRRDLLYTFLNIILNIEKHYKNFCKCNENILCPPCTVANTYRNKQYSLFENCFDFDFIHKVSVHLNESLLFLHKDMSHFIFKIYHDRFHFEHKCFFTGKICEMDL